MPRHRVVALSAAVVILTAGFLFAFVTSGNSRPRRSAAPVTIRASASALAAFAVQPGGSWDTGYQQASPGQVVSISGGTYPGQTIGQRPTLNGSVCSDLNRTGCVELRVDGNVTMNGPLEIHGSGLWIDCRNQATIKGYIDTEGDGGTGGPSNIIVENCKSVSFGVFNASNVLFRNLDVGPGTAYWDGAREVCCREGSGLENKIGFGGGGTLVPQNVVLDGLHIHDQNGDATRKQPNADVHFGGLFLMTANGLTIENTTFDHNVVYNVQIQNFGGAPPAQNVTFLNDAFGCPADWLYNPASCDGQSSIQFDGTFPGVSVLGSAFAEGGDRGWGCYVGTCDFSRDTFQNNTFGPPSLTPPALPSNPPPPVTTTVTTTPTTTTVPTTTAVTTTTPTQCSPGVGGLAVTATRTNSTITLTWTAPAGAVGYQFLRDCQIVSTTNDGTRASVKFSLRAGSVYTVRPVAKLSEGSVKG